MRKNTIIITSSCKECIELHDFIGETKWKNCFTKQYPTDSNFYNKMWYWWFDENNKLSGVAGHSSMETAVRLNPGAQIFFLSDFVKQKN